VFHDRPKYIEIKYYILRDEVQKIEAILQYISTDEKRAYILVNPLSKMKSMCVGARGDEFLIEKGKYYS
jgi:hypothetical protein